MNQLTDLEFLILDEVYFVTSYSTILQNIGSGAEEFRKTLIGLLEKQLVSQMKYNNDLKDFDKLESPDLSALSESSFVATRQGLLIHNSRN
jgi:hypothetical protein